MTQLPTLALVPGHGGTKIAVHRLGEGSPIVLIHGLASNAMTNWVRYGHAAALADAGFEAVMIDLRCHGASEAPRDPADYPHDVAMLDLEVVLAALDLGEIDLVGYSLGARLSVMLVAHGLKPRRLVLGGMGYETLTDWSGRRDAFLAMLDRFETTKLGDPDFLSIQFMKTTRADPVALRLLLESTGNIAPELLDRVAMPTLVVTGADDRDVGSPALLAERLPHARHETVPGNHMSCVTKPDLGAAILRFLGS